MKIKWVVDARYVPRLGLIHPGATIEAEDNMAASLIKQGVAVHAIDTTENESEGGNE